MTHDNIISKVQSLASKILALKEENRRLKQENSSLTLTIAEVQNRAEEVESQHTANSANLLMFKQKEDLMLAAQEDLQTNFDHAQKELSICLQSLKEKDAQLQEVKVVASHLTLELNETTHSIDEKNNIITLLQQKLSTQADDWEKVLHDKDNAITQFTDELKAAAHKLESLHSEREALSTQLDDLILHLDGQIEQLKPETNG